MIVKNLQKTAANFHELHYPLDGDFDIKDFAPYFDLNFYQPSPDLAPFVVYYSVLRPKIAYGKTLTMSMAMQTPGAGLLVSKRTAKVFGVTTGQIINRITGDTIKVRAHFRPAGFYAFWDKPMSELVDQALPLAEVFPAADSAFVADLLACPRDLEVVSRLESLLRQKQPVYDKNIGVVDDIIQKIEDDELYTVAEVAKACAKSERTLQQLFYTYVGVGIKRIIMRNRIMKAMQLADAADKINWTTIAADLGYSTQSHFVHDFKKLAGYPPSKFRTQ
ncbi:MAG TPA: helix-turn-helix transcriptional regulator [Candidatus Saccharimonadales bacterium]|nr:helix-turn-helix transcriptional regulator [Candidatus Saccharimonadales bacterium]